MTIGERIKKLRLQSGLTQEELGNSIGAIKQTINKYENGTITNIPTDKIEARAKVFGVSEAFIMGWEKEYVEEDDIPRDKEALLEYFHKTPELKVLFSLAEDLSEKDIDFLINMAKRMKGE